jgi:NADP-dependent 3-hydroxy acid dehydrogenase YdfG
MLSGRTDRTSTIKYGISPGRIANIAAFAIDQPEDTTINEFTVGRPTSR